ncbi:glycosyltransferase family 4 protein [Vicingus serpentipes]|uniref:Glycosyltransferase family 4 protein n=1 Tax=Vicingus serpentipes TaxID=1926625 RepID=A0A5C6RYH6_9FLAO|nr:glycosyltransferase family 4 protein [Vicingus serpentipes]TXB66700.1 glycosyltransferase family 4 protein [Vicingus serpentipes]
MKVLQICSKPPVPSIDGGCKAMNNITEGLLSNNIRVKVLTISTAKHPFLPEKISADYIEKTNIEHFFIDTRVKPISALLNLCKSNSYNLSRFYCKKFEELIVSTLDKEEFEVIILEGLFVSGYIDSIRKNTKAKIVFRAHNVEHEIWERNTQNERKGIKKIYLKKLADQLKVQEIEVLKNVDVIASITQRDKQQIELLGCETKVKVIPFGINVSNYLKAKTESKFTFFHIGSMDWTPNQIGIKWLLNNVWGNILSSNNDLVLKLAGKNMPEWLLKLNQKNVEIVGQVEDAIDFINQNQVMIVPLFSGGGMRIKIVEGMALGKTVIATSIALEGIDYVPNKNVIVANKKEEFITAINWCLKNKEEAKQIGENALQLIHEKYDNNQIIKDLISLF